MSAKTYTRYLAFLRGMNVGGHRVTMDELREHFGALGFTNVETFIASGNVIFDAPTRMKSAALEQRIETKLREALGYDVSTFLRTAPELDAIARNVPFAAADVANPAFTVYVGFLRTTPTAAFTSLLLGSATAMDILAMGEREYYWLCRGKSLESLVKWPVIEKAAKLELTVRNLNTVQRLVKKYPAST